MGREEYDYIALIEDYVAGHISRVEYASSMQLNYPSVEHDEALSQFLKALEIIELAEMRKTLKNPNS